MATVDHVSAIVQDLEKAVKMFVDVFGFKTGPISENPVFGIKFAFLEGKNTKLELIQPIAQGPYLEFLEKRLFGFNHIAIQVDNLSETAERLSKLGIKTRTESPFVGGRGSVWDLDPKTTQEVRLQIFEAKK